MKSFTVVALVGFVAFAAFSVSLKRELRGNDATQRIIQQGMPVPNFQAQDMSGNVVDLHVLAKSRKAVVVTFWATWCDPCVRELANLQKIYPPQKAAGAEFIAVVLDPSQAPAFLAGKNLPFPVIPDEGQRIAKSFGIRTLPSTVIVVPTLVVSRSMEGSSVVMTDRMLGSLMRARRQ